VPKATQELPVRLVRLVLRATKVTLALPVLLVQPVPLAHLVRSVPLAPLVLTVPMVPLAEAYWES